jgi:GDPmannose 4,6-dehydratase
MWAMLQQETPDDYVLATGEGHTVREFVERAFAQINRDIAWSGSGADEIGTDAKSGQVLVRIDPRYFRPTEVERLLGDAGKALAKLGWRHTIGFDALVREMVAEDLKAMRRSRNFD